MQQLEKAVLGRSSRSRSEPNAKVAEENSEKDRGTDSEEDEDEAPKKRPVSPYVLIHRVASIKIYETCSDQCKKKYYGLFTRSI